MADAREKSIWDHHALEHDTKYNKAYTFNDDAALFSLFKRLRDEYGIGVVVDLGCGSALWRNMFVGIDYIGVDQNARMLSVAKKRFPADTFIQANGMDLPFDDSSVDMVFTSAVLQHNCLEDKNKVVTEMVRVLRPGGIYLCTETTFRPDNYHVVFKDKKFSDDITDGYSYTKVGWEHYLGSFGFSLLEYMYPSEYAYKLDK